MEQDIQSRFIHVLRTQASHKPAREWSGSWPCPFGHNGRVFQTVDQLLAHAKDDHPAEVIGLDRDQGRKKMKEAIIRSRQSESPDIEGLSLDPDKQRQTSPTSGKKRRADNDIHSYPKKGTPASDNVVIVDPEYSRTTKGSTKSRSRTLYNPKQSLKATRSPRRSNTDNSNDRQADVASALNQHSASEKQSQDADIQMSAATARQPGMIELQNRDPRYPGLLLQPASRPISQDQLASEVKSIYAGLAMVETKCIHVDRAQAAAPPDPTQKLAPDHWQALIALHRTLLHEHHDFFLASQHPSASAALRRLAAKYTMPARMWKHGIHSFLELLRRRLPESLDFMLAFIYLAYQMMALLYETVPAFENTWIECLGDLGRYRMAIEDEDIRDRETWANVARSWYTKAADRNPPVGRLYHHLAILARPNALHQLYYYGRSLNSVEPFPSARESILTLFDPVLGRAPSNMSTTHPIDVSFMKSHAYTFEKDTTDKYVLVRDEYINQLDNHIGKVTAKWKEQGVYTAVTNIASWFDYGYNTNILRQLFLLRFEQRKNPEYMVEERDLSLPPDPDLQRPRISERNIPAKLNDLLSDNVFFQARRLTNDTLSVALGRNGDKNVLPHVHVMLSFLYTFASIEYVAHFIDSSPWTDISAFLNTLIKTEIQQGRGVDINNCIRQPVFPSDADAQKQGDLPLPEDYLIRGLIWAEEYLPVQWFERSGDEEDRYLELASTAKRRVDRVLRLGFQLSTLKRWISYDEEKHTFAHAEMQ